MQAPAVLPKTEFTLNASASNAKSHCFVKKKVVAPELHPGKNGDASLLRFHIYNITLRSFLPNALSEFRHCKNATH
jgi:hypothetical protein